MSMNPTRSINTIALLWKVPLLLVSVAFVSWLYAFTIWYGSVLVISFIALFLFPLSIGVIYRRIFSDYIKPLGFQSVLVAYMLITISTYFYWIFWFDLTLNQSSWIKVESQFSPIDFFKPTSTNITQCLYLLTHPDRLISFLSVQYDHGYFSLFGFRLRGLALLILLICEYALGGYIIYLLTEPSSNSAIEEIEANQP